ncbi:MAG: preprotein translocase subunit SecG [Candidatus Levybacteria bacterium]|nr:preprotein translocase subunit SecG [Candidatus Levybacteria bacterium]
MFIIVFQIVISFFLIVSILLQMQGSGFSASFGSASEFYRTKRSMEKILFWITVILASIFGIVSIILLLPHK